VTFTGKQYDLVAELGIGWISFLQNVTISKKTAISPSGEPGRLM